MAAAAVTATRKKKNPTSDIFHSPSSLSLSLSNFLLLILLKGPFALLSSTSADSSNESQRVETQQILLSLPGIETTVCARKENSVSKAHLSLTD